MTSLDKTIRKITDESDIAFHSDVYKEIVHSLTDICLNLAFFVFRNSVHSIAARTLADGNTISCPSVKLYLKYDNDFRQTGIDSHQGNWDDKCAQTGTVRDTVNAILQRHEYGSDYVSEHTYIFVDTLEKIAFCQIGRECKSTVRDLVSAAAPGVKVTHVFWNGAQYNVIMRDKSDYKRVKRKVKAKVTKALPKLLATADENGYCQSYKATIEFGYTGMNLYPLMCDDC